MLDYKNIIIKHYALSLSGSEIARQLGASKSGVNDFLRAFDKCESLSYPLPPGITNYGIDGLVYGSVPGSGGCNENIEYQKLIVLCTDICERNGKNKLLWLENKDRTLNYKPVADEMVLTVHRWFANKSCPGNWMYS